MYIRTSNHATKLQKTSIMEHTSFTSIGELSKKETLATVEHNTNTNALVLETLSLFPGYHGTTVPEGSEPQSLFLVTKIIHSDDKIIRAIRNIKKDFPYYFDGAPCKLNLYNKPAGAIRIKDLSYEHIGKLVERFSEEGFEFLKAKTVAEFSTIIKITKFFKLQSSGDGIYSDENWEGMYYIQIPVQLRWNSFEKITNSIKHNIEDSNFDAALTSMYSEEGVLDFVRIYDAQCCQDKLKFIRDKYLEAIKYI